MSVEVFLPSGTTIVIESPSTPGVVEVPAPVGVPEVVEVIQQLGQRGSVGPEGLSAYEVAVVNGFVGSEAEWLDWLIGPAGDSDFSGLWESDRTYIVLEIVSWNGSLWRSETDPNLNNEPTAESPHWFLVHENAAAYDDTAVLALIDGHETRLDALEPAVAGHETRLDDLEAAPPPVGALADLTDVDLTGALDGDVLTREGGVWIAQVPSGGGGGGTPLVVSKKALGNVFAGLINAALTNGNRAAGDYVNLGGSPTVVTVDMGEETAFEDIDWVLYHGDARIFQGVRLEGSHDNVAWTDIRAAAPFQPSTTGTVGLVIPVNASWRYLRFTTNGSDSYPGSNEWVEIYAPLEVVTDVTGTGVGGVVEDEDNVVLPARSKLQIVGATITDDEAGDRTVVTISAPSGGTSLHSKPETPHADSDEFDTGTLDPKWVMLGTTTADVVGVPDWAILTCTGGGVPQGMYMPIPAGDFDIVICATGLVFPGRQMWGAFVSDNAGDGFGPLIDNGDTDQVRGITGWSQGGGPAGSGSINDIDTAFRSAIKCIFQITRVGTVYTMSQTAADFATPAIRSKRIVDDARAFTRIGLLRFYTDNGGDTVIGVDYVRRLA